MAYQYSSMCGFSACARRDTVVHYGSSDGGRLQALVMNNLMKQNKSITSLLLPLLVFCPVAAALAELRLPSLFSDNMVLQQGAPLRVWGWADDGSLVTVKFLGQQADAIATNGAWRVTLRAQKSGTPGTLTVTAGTRTIERTNVLLGDVWVCSGQSNMEWPLAKSFQPEADIAAATNDQIRLFLVAKKKASKPEQDVQGTWVVCSPKAVASFSAVGYYFGRDLQKARKTAVGLIGTYWGGSPAEAWTREGVLQDNPRYQAEIIQPHRVAMKKHQEALAAYEKEKAESGAGGFTKKPPVFGWSPSELYNGMIAPLIPYTIKGAIWYQGESNAGRAEQYRTLFPDMIRCWRKDWGQGDFPFIAVQLAPFKKIQDEPGDSNWAELREAQWLATKTLKNTGMAVITDVGDPADIHPTKKQPVGERLALQARRIAYGESITSSGPAFRSLKVKGAKAVVSFDPDSIGGGLEARGGELKGFALCGEDRKFIWASAVIEGRTVVVTSPQVPKPVAVRYGWADCPVVNLWNKEGLPATPFRTDDFPMTTATKK